MQLENANYCRFQTKQFHLFSGFSFVGGSKIPFFHAQKKQSSFAKPLEPLSFDVTEQFSRKQHHLNVWSNHSMSNVVICVFCFLFTTSRTRIGYSLKISLWINSIFFALVCVCEKRRRECRTRMNRYSSNSVWILFKKYTLKLLTEIFAYLRFILTLFFFRFLRSLSVETKPCFSHGFSFVCDCCCREREKNKQEKKVVKFNDNNEPNM